MSHCKICKGPLNVPDRPETEDCGGDCLMCMAVIGEDPDCEHALVQAFAADIKKLTRRYFSKYPNPNSHGEHVLMRFQEQTSLYSPYVWSDND